jgi:16S rRNA (cytosine1407-C5)-methyltransferase
MKNSIVLNTLGRQNEDTKNPSSLERFRDSLGDEGYQALLNELEKPLPSAIRANLLKVAPDRAIQKWQQSYDWEINPISFCPYGWQIISSNVSISRTIEHRMGEYYVQDAASMLPVSLLEESSNDGQLILDMAASPGGKTTQLIDVTGDRSFVIANDTSASRLQALRIVLQTWGAMNFAITNYPGEQMGSWFPEVFDVILLDAPCSMENFRSTASHPLRSTTTSERDRLSLRQSLLIQSAFRALKPGGQLIFATCSLAPEEDELVLDNLLKVFPGLVSLDKSQVKGIYAPGLTSFMGRKFDPSVTNAFRLWPHIAGTSGFFAARINKSGSTCKDIIPPPMRSFSKTGLQPLSSAEINLISSILKDTFGFSIDEMCQKNNISLFRRHETIYGHPQIYLDRFQTLPFHTLGMRFGKLINQDFQPSHELLSRFGYNFSRGIIELPDELVPLWMAGQDLRSYLPSNGPSRGPCLIMDQHGRNLGGGNIQANRIRNLLPTHSLLSS